MISDPISDCLTRIRNASRVFIPVVRIPFSKIKLEIIKILHNEGYILNYKVVEDGKSIKDKIIMVALKYRRKEPAIYRLERISKPGCRKYFKSENLPRMYNGLGIAIISTSQGVMTDKEARKRGVGGEGLCSVF